MNNEILLWSWIILQLIIGYNLILPILLFILYSIIPKKNIHNVGSHTNSPDYAVIVTAYEQTESLPAVVESILKLNYVNYLIYIVADKCDVSNLNFPDKRVIVLRPPETLASNTRSHFYAINHFVRNHDMLTIIDSDNLVDKDYLIELNKYVDSGFEAVQGLRRAKNLDTTFACLDAARDIYYHFYDGEVLFNLGSSATLSGSGMAFKTKLYKDCLEHLDITGAGFDKVLQNAIVSRGNRIAFTEHAIVYDEKTSKSDQLVKQRARWIFTWFRFFKYGFSLVGVGIIKLNWNKFLFGTILLRPPLFIFLILSALFASNNLAAYIYLSITGNVDLSNVFLTMIICWLVGFAGFIGGFMIALNHSKPDKRITKSLAQIPKFIFYQVLALLHIRNRNKLTVATVHYSETTIQDIEKK